MKKLRSSTFLNDFYRDLRDRRLLLPIAGLAVAIVAVPMLIGGGPEATAPPPTPAPVDAEAGAELAPAVLASDPGVRDYRQRLAKLKESNPFVQKFTLPNPEQAALESVSSGAGGSSSSSGDSVSTGASSASSTTSVTDTVTDTTVTDSGGDITTSTDTVTTDTSSSEGHSKPPKTVTRFYAGRVDVTVGPRGDAKPIDDVRVLDFVPSEKDPVVAFLGLSHGTEAAVFSVSRDVVQTDGQGSCSPKPPAACEYLTLREGEQRTLTFADGTTYRLRVLHIDVVAVPDPRVQQGADQADASGG
jgi:hypothetical protein